MTNEKLVRNKLFLSNSKSKFPKLTSAWDWELLNDDDEEEDDHDDDPEE